MLVSLVPPSIDYFGQVRIVLGAFQIAIGFGDHHCFLLWLRKRIKLCRLLRVWDRGSEGSGCRFGRVGKQRSPGVAFGLVDYEVIEFIMLFSKSAWHAVFKSCPYLHAVLLSRL
jgi:hypothetical protein